jgi:hypothetical protein
VLFALLATARSPAGEKSDSRRIVQGIKLVNCLLWACVSPKFDDLKLLDYRADAVDAERLTRTEILDYLNRL